MGSIRRGRLCTLRFHPTKTSRPWIHCYGVTGRGRFALPKMSDHDKAASLSNIDFAAGGFVEPDTKNDGVHDG